MTSASPAVEARASFRERREPPSEPPEPFAFGAAAVPGVDFAAGADSAARRPPRRSPRQPAAPAPEPARPPPAQPFIFQGADQPARTPHSRRTVRARAATPQSAHSAEGMVWSPSEADGKVASEFGQRLNLDHHQQQHQHFTFEAAQPGVRPARRTGRPTPRRAASTDSTANGSVFGGAGQPQQQPPQPLPFVFGASAAAQQPPQQPPPPPPLQPQPQPFVFGAAQGPGPAAAPAVPLPPEPTFISLSDLLKTGAPGAPMRRRRQQHRAGGRARGAAAPAPAAAAPAPAAAAPSPVRAPPASAPGAAADRARVRGNELFREHKYGEAFKLYTEAINALMACEDAGPQLALLLSNRAAAALALGRPLQALQDCRMGLVHGPTFMKCALRVVTCFARMGEFGEARAAAAEARGLVPPGDAAALAQVEAKEAEVDQAEAALGGALRGLGHAVAGSGTGEGPKRVPLAEAVRHLDAQSLHFPHAEVYYAARAEALLRLGQLDEAGATVAKAPHADAPAARAGAPWRVWLRAQLAFHCGQAAEALELLATVRGGVGPAAGGLEATVVPLPSAEEAAALAEGLAASERLKADGNAAVGAGKYAAALEAYTAAFAAAPLPPALAAVLCCNRAAAHQGLGNVALAIADCCRAKVLAPGYAKAHSRLAALLGEVGMHSAAADELAAALAMPKLTPAVRAEYQRRLKAAREAATPRRTFYGGVAEAPPPNHYKLLGLERSCAADQVRKVYKKLALQLHPDKASVRFAARWGPGAELAEPAAATRAALEEGATWLFKCLGEANDTLTDPQKRRELDGALAAAEAGTARASSHHHHHNRPPPAAYHYGGFSYGGGGAGYYRPYEHGFSYGGGGGGRSAGHGSSSFYRHYW